MEKIVPSKEQLEYMKKSIEGWRAKIESYKRSLIQDGVTEEEAQRVIDPSISFNLGREEEIQEYEDFYRMEKGVVE